MLGVEVIVIYRSAPTVGETTGLRSPPRRVYPLGHKGTLFVPTRQIQ